MAIFNYSAYKDGSQEILTGKVEAIDIRSARAEVRNLGLTAISVTEEKSISSRVKSKKKKGEGMMPKLGLREQIDFTSTMQILSASGIAIIESLLFIENESAKLKIRQCAAELRRQIMNGGTFAGTIAKYPEQFGQVYIGLVRAGEDSGELEKTLDRLLERLNKQAAIRQKVIGTLMYPMFVILLAVFIVIVMVVFLKKNWIAIPFGFGIAVFLVNFLMKWKPSRWKIDSFVLKIPKLSELIQFSNFANFIAVMQVAYDAGVPILECLYLSNLTLTNHTLATRVEEATVRVQQGQHLSSALRATRTMPKMILFMIATGEQSGRLGDMLLQAVNYIDKELDNIIDVLTKMIEPIMLLVIGTIVLILASALYLPLFASYMGM